MMKYLHTMIRVTDIDETVKFFELLGLQETHRHESEKGRFTLVFLVADVFGWSDCSDPNGPTRPIICSVHTHGQAGRLASNISDGLNTIHIVAQTSCLDLVRTEWRHAIGAGS